MPELEEPALQLNGDELSPNSSDSEQPVPHQRPSSSTDYGKRVLFYSTQDKKEKCGVLRYLGVPEFAEGLWCGIELDQPEGKNNGSIHGIRYFICDPSYGVFVPLSKVELDPSRRVRKISGRNGGGEAKKMNNGVGKSAPFIQQELTQRLTQPAITKRKNAQAGVTNWRQPMKAFATQGVSVSRQPKKQLAPFRAGGMYKAQSSENIRALRDKESSQQSKPVKKSSSERDLRSANNKGNNKTEVVKSRRKPARTNSLSDISADSTAPSTTSSSDQSNRHSADLSGSKAFHRWPLTSTPSNRDDSSPDGCSSPDEADVSSTSGGDGAQLITEPLKQNRIASTLVTADKAFLHSTDIPAEPKASLPTGLATQTSQLIEGERSSQGVGDCRVPSPEHGAGKPRYHNHRSGTATLDHPLTQATNAPEDSASLADPFHSLEEGVSMVQMMELFKEQYKQWHSTRVMLESKVDQLEKQLQEAQLSHKQEVERLHKGLQEVQTKYEVKVRQQEATRRAEVQQTHSNHQQELIALHKAHRHAMEEQQREFECQRGKHTVV